jgi:uncharacterized membrane protein YkvA (DUF1232 family)
MVLFRGLLRDPRVPRSAKLWLGFAVVWIASPIDLVPKFIPIAGPLDDAIVAALVLRHLLRRTDRSVLFEHWRGDPATLERSFVGGVLAGRETERSPRAVAARSCCPATTWRSERLLDFSPLPAATVLRRSVPLYGWKVTRRDRAVANGAAGGPPTVFGPRHRKRAR